MGCNKCGFNPCICLILQNKYLNKFPKRKIIIHIPGGN